jgi:hypothetical protein
MTTSPGRNSASGRVPPSAIRIGVSPARQYEQAWEQPRYGLMVHSNGTRDAPGTRLMMDLARIS